MNCAEYRELLVGYIEGLLDDNLNQAIKSHLDICAECRKELEQVTALQKRLVANGASHSQNDLENAVMDRIVREQAFKLRKANQGQYLNFWRLTMRSPIMKLAVAAVIIIAVLTGIYLITGKAPSVTCCAWAEVAKKLETIKSCVCNLKMTQTGGPLGQRVQNVDSTMFISSEYGYRMDNYVDGNLVQQMYVSPIEKTSINVLPPQKQYMRLVLTDDMVAGMKTQNQDPRDLIKNLLSGISPGMSGQFTKLGRKVVDGVEAEGIEVVNPPGFEGMYDNFIGKMWIDVKTEMPVRLDIEADVTTGNQVIHQSIVMSEFEWDAQLEPEVFEPNIPANYTMMADVQMPGQDEAGAIEGLRFFAELKNGSYPSKMNVMSTIQEAIPGLEKRLNISKGVEPDKQAQQEITKAVIQLQGPFMFYTKLAQENKEPAYYGDKVTTEFPDAILMRWKVADNQYRIIFGNLTVKTVTAAELAELETMPLNRQPKAIKPSPVDGAVDGRLADLQLSWMPGMSAAAHKIYMGTSTDTLTLLSDVATDSNVTVTDLQRNTTYYWRVDDVDANGKATAGNVWSFNTGSLVGWWKLDETTGTTAYDSSGNGNNGTLVGNPVWQQGALKFNGDSDYVEIGNKTDFNITGQITLSAWIQVSEFTKDYQAIVTKGDSAWRLSRGQGNGLHFACSGVNAQSSWVNGTKEVSDGKWHQVVGVYDGKEMRLYVDGVLDASASATGKITVNDSPVMIGENAQLRGREWNGLVDDVRIYNYALSEDEIGELYKGSH